FMLPDSDGYSGYVSMRMGFMAFLFLLLFLVCLDSVRIVRLVMIAVALVLIIGRGSYFKSNMHTLNQRAIEIERIAQHIEAYAVILPMRVGTDRLEFWHVHNYLGIDKPMVILDNYECNLNYFPLVWD